MGSGETRMEIKPRLIWNKFFKRWLCFTHITNKLSEVGLGITFYEAYFDWKTKQEKIK